MRPKLIVNGDDLGRTESLTRGVMAAYEGGILTSTSIVASSRHFDLAVDLAKAHPDLGVGVHLVVNEYAPVAPPRDIPHLVNARGEFHSRPAALAKILLGRVPRAEIVREWQAQIARVVDAGLEPTHLDGHGHCHAVPPLAEVVAGLVARFGIPAVRLPAERLSWRGVGGGLALKRHLEKGLLFGACLRPRARWRGRLRHPDTFFGFMDAGRLSAAALEAVAYSLGPGVSELMTHPALDNGDPPYGLDYDWRGDYDALFTWGKAEFEERFGVSLVSFRDAWGDA